MKAAHLDVTGINKNVISSGENYSRTAVVLHRKSFQAGLLTEGA